jgi:hypothetical protein
MKKFYVNIILSALLGLGVITQSLAQDRTSISGAVTSWLKCRSPTAHPRPIP